MTKIFAWFCRHRVLRALGVPKEALKRNRYSIFGEMLERHRQAEMARNKEVSAMIWECWEKGHPNKIGG